MKKMAILILALTLLLTSIPLVALAADDEKYSAPVDGTDKEIVNGSVIVYPNDSDAVREIAASTYNFRTAKLMVVDKNGQVIEAGSDLYDTAGSPQLSVKIPAGGFLIAMGSGVSNDAKKVFNIAMSDAMLYNATMTVIRDIKCTFDSANMKLDFTVKPEKEETEDTIQFLFVGNSTTYFNGTPLKFKALCEAAGIDVAVTYCTEGSAYLYEFADSTHARGIKLRNTLKNKKFDYVVLQDAGNATLEQTDSALQTILPLIEENGATPLLYMRYSSEQDEVNRKYSVSNYYRIYSTIAEKYSMPFVPVVLAFDYCIDTYPEIPMYGDDNSHHSAEGSYLIACTWLYKYFGVSPVGNTYTANLDADVAAKLQEMAKRSVDDKYDPISAMQKVYTDENGKEYKNIAFEKKYTSDGAKYSQGWTDTDDNGSPLGKYTDGFEAVKGDDINIGAYSSQRMNIIIDLEGKYSIKRLTTDLFGGTWGIGDPNKATVTFSVSTDGKNYTILGTAKAEETSEVEDWQRVLYALTLDETVEANFIKVNYSVSGNFCWLSEINVFSDNFKSGAPDEESTPDTSATDESKNDNIGHDPDDGFTVDDESKTETKSNGVLKTVLGITAGVLLAGGVIAFLSRKKKK